MKLATAAYQMDFLNSWDDYVAKLTEWVSEAASNGAELMVFPEFGCMELATLKGRATAMDLEASLHAVNELIPRVDALHAELAKAHGAHILAASAPVFDPAYGPRPVNRARFFAPSGAMVVQDKQIMTRFEREDWDVVPGCPLQLFDTSLGKIGILICYDSQYPLLGRALSEADMILVPSTTEAAYGFNRVRSGCRARAIEQQCITVMSSTVGDCDWSTSVETSRGRGGVFGPPDTGFPEDGIIAQGVMDRPGWTYADVDLDAVARVRKDGVVLNRTHWDEQAGRDHPAELRSLS
ncbi:carbon-nitrogen hydrolase family protein [Salipiger sp. 1_MG-2023]|uniref:carbon-nitrogen hydrolase family protein n=1 Tax=Salipiger sp. 1_MG-2023 TaxID=3062665 RepID=UPI0026E335AF|nr:carbon-nitrogen hydrolase family protein [Salipiger sp. 1_MG-2023]MDO6586887.1 carbon-nitrogen hydrolase family protein [Salipiger sp. 1_MG-2023]